MSNEIKTKIEQLPAGTQELVNSGKVTYRGRGWTVKDGFLEGSLIKINGKEHIVSRELFNELGGIQKMRFSAPERKHT